MGKRVPVQRASNAPVGRTAKLAARRAEVLRLRAEHGMSFRQIAKRIGTITHTTAWKDYDKALAEIHQREYKHTAKLRTEAAHRVNSIMRVLRAKIDDPKDPETLPAINTYLRAQEQLNRLMGLDAPTKIEQTTTTGIVLEFRERVRLEDPADAIIIEPPDPDEPLQIAPPPPEPNP